MKMQFCSYLYLLNFIRNEESRIKESGRKVTGSFRLRLLWDEQHTCSRFFFFKVLCQYMKLEHEEICLAKTSNGRRLHSQLQNRTSAHSGHFFFESRRVFNYNMVTRHGLRHVKHCGSLAQR